MRIIDRYIKQDIQDQFHEYCLMHDHGDTWSVFCYSGYDRDELEFMWEVKGKWEGGVEDHVGRVIGGMWIPFTEELARKEFERWRT